MRARRNELRMPLAAAFVVALALAAAVALALAAAAFGGAQAHIPVRSKEIKLAVVADWEAYNDAQLAVSDLGMRARVVPTDDVSAALREELRSSDAVVVVDHLNDVKEVLSDEKLAGIVIQPGPNSMIGEEGGEVRVVVVNNDDIRAGIAAALVQLAGSSKAETEEIPTSLLPLSTLLAGFFPGLVLGVLLAKKRQRNKPEGCGDAQPHDA